MIVALAGGVGGARLALGLAAALPPDGLTVIVNTGDDFEHLGLSISPDLDTVMYTLAGVADRERGWGWAGETWHFMETLERLGGETWFQLGDRDLAVHVTRSQALARGERLSDITRALCRKLNVGHAVVPMSDDPVRTIVLTNDGELPFQDYFVRQRCAPVVTGFRFEGSDAARPPETLSALFGKHVEAVIVCPSNPYISIAPILAVKAIREWLEARRFPVVAVSPIIGGEAVKGPAAKMMRELGVNPGVPSVVRHYGDLVDGWVIDERDAEASHEIVAMRMHVASTDTLMTDRARSVALARVVLDGAARLRKARS